MCKWVHKPKYNTKGFAIDLVLKCLQMVSLSKSKGLMYTCLMKSYFKMNMELLDHDYNEFSIYRAMKCISMCQGY